MVNEYLEELFLMYKDSNNESINENLLASSIDEFSKDMKLFPLTDKEWDIVSDEYQKLIK